MRISEIGEKAGFRQKVVLGDLGHVTWEKALNCNSENFHSAIA